MSSTLTITKEKASKEKVSQLPTLTTTYNCWLKPNVNFVPPANFRYPDAVAELPLNPKGPTELPWKLHWDFTGVSLADLCCFGSAVSGRRHDLT